MFRKDSHRHFAFIYLPYLVVLSLGFLTFIAIQHAHFSDIVKHDESLQIDLGAQLLVRDFSQVLPDITLLSNDYHVQAFLNEPNAGNRQLLEHKFSELLESKKSYRMIRILNNVGMEQVRVDYLNGKTIVTPENALQDKSQRYYFQNSIKLPPGQIYISPIDLNIENEKIETPHMPMIRLAIPLHDRLNKKSGIIIINYQADILLQYVDKISALSYGNIELLNHDGYWIRSYLHEREWGFMFDKNMHFQEFYPHEWQIITSQNKGQFESKQGLFTFTSIHPVATNTDPGNNIDMPPDWILVSQVPVDSFNQNIRQHVLGFVGMLWLTLAILGLFTAYLLAGNKLERKRLQEHLKLHSQIFSTSTDGIFITDSEKNILDVNAAFLDISGYSLDELIGKNPRIFSSGRHDQRFYREMYKALYDHGHWEGEIYNRHKNGNVYTEWLRITAIKDASGKLTNYIALASDITHKKSTEEQLIKHALHDPLTGAHNRRSFEDRLKHDMLLSRRNHCKLALLLFDVDNMKPVNDSYGHQAGDLVLQTIVNRITRHTRESDTLARLGGDEFIIILPELDSAEDAKKIANTLCHAIRDPIKFTDRELQVTASVGIAIYPDDGTDQQQLINFADQQMYINKITKGGKDNP